MKVLIDYINKKENLLQLSAGITVGILMLLFILAQVWRFASLLTNSDQVKMEVRELVKLKFVPEIEEQKEVIIDTQPERINYKQKQFPKIPQQHNQKSERKPNLASLVKDFNIEELVTFTKGTVNRRKGNEFTEASAGISTNVKSHIQEVSNLDLNGKLPGKTAYTPSKRRAVSGGNQGPKVGVGGTSDFGSGIGSAGVDLSGTGAKRATRGTGGGSGSLKIGLPAAGNGGENAAIDLHALIKWMKAHPGAIPKLVAHDMGHQSGDLSSAVTFMMNGRSYNLFLSCNEIELLLRICLVEGNEFTLLKDNGIKENSNFLTIGNVVRQRGQIQSLISSRRAPGASANSFYQIFWSWWQGQQ